MANINNRISFIYVCILSGARGSGFLLYFTGAKVNQLPERRVFSTRTRNRLKLLILGHHLSLWYLSPLAALSFKINPTASIHVKEGVWI